MNSLQLLNQPKEKKGVSKYVKSTFYATYALLFTTGTITFIEALRTDIPEVRHIMNLETCISLVAGFYYSLFNTEIKEAEDKNLPIDYHAINNIRYSDWIITTPLMILVLCATLAYNKKMPLHLLTYFILFVLDVGMIGLGYLGETKTINRTVALITSFICFFLMFGLIGYTYFQGKSPLANYIIFGAFVIIWGIYGLIYNLEEDKKNIIFNALDGMAKSVMGICLWGYFTKIVVA
jgi:bacteriorhodopsin